MSNPLDTATDELTQLLRQAEEQFRKMKAGVTAEVKLDHETVLTFEKVGATWLLCCRVTKRGKTQALPLMTGSRRLRVMAAMALPEMYEAILDAQASNVEAVEAACDRVQEFLKQFGET